MYSNWDKESFTKYCDWYREILSEAAVEEFNKIASDKAKKFVESCNKSSSIDNSDTEKDKNDKNDKQ